MKSYNPDRRGLSEVRLLNLEPWRMYPRGEALSAGFLATPAPEGPRLTKRTPIASIGSCFAREIKRWLLERGYRYLQAADGPCTEAGSARYDRVYNTFTLKQEFERAFGRFEPRETRWDFVEDGRRRLLDPYRKNVAWDDEAEMHRELAEHREAVRRAFTQCEVLIVTVGQAEVWYHKADGYVYPLIPPVQVYDPEKHGFRLSTFEENVANLERVLTLFRANNPRGRVIVTVSPVPLRATFRRVHSVIANSASKSMLRAAVDAFVGRHEDAVSYFPSYELVTAIERDPFEEDNRHVKPEVVNRIMRLFEAWYVEGAATALASSTASGHAG